MDQRSLSYDVVVVGGGAAGLAAAVASARAGARTRLVERSGFLGGMATPGMVSTICGLYHTSSAGPPEPLNAGFAETVAHRLAAMPGCSAPVRRGRTHILPYTPFAFACMADELTASAGDLDVYLHAFLAALETGSRRVETLRLATWERRIELTARAVVDASGDAVVPHLAGVATVTMPLPDRQPAPLCSVLRQVATDALGNRSPSSPAFELMIVEPMQPEPEPSGCGCASGRLDASWLLAALVAGTVRPRRRRVA